LPAGGSRGRGGDVPEGMLTSRVTRDGQVPRSAALSWNDSDRGLQVAVGRGFALLPASTRLPSTAKPTVFVGSPSAPASPLITHDRQRREGSSRSMGSSASRTGIFTRRAGGAPVWDERGSRMTFRRPGAPAGAGRCRRTSASSEPGDQGPLVGEIQGQKCRKTPPQARPNVLLQLLRTASLGGVVPTTQFDWSPSSRRPSSRRPKHQSTSGQRGAGQD